MFDLSSFSSYREDNRLEIKKAKTDIPNSLWETYSSFANCEGGVIILGISERTDGSWYTTGLLNEAKQRKSFWDTINNKSKVSANLLTDSDVETLEVPAAEGGNHVIMIIHVPKADRTQKPIYLNNDLFGASFRRNWEGDYRCTPEEVKAMLRDQPEESGDTKILADMPLSVLDADTIHSYRNRHMAYRSDHVWERLSDDEYLERIGAARISRTDGTLHPTVAGLLMFGEEYKILYEFPEYFLDYRETLDPTIRWTDRLQSSSGDWTGNLFDFFFRVYSKLVKDVKIPFRMENGIRIDDTPVHKAIREALANCLVNADFYFPRGVVIIKNEDSIIMENPGSIRTGKAQMLKGGISDPRNKIIMKMLGLIGIGERAGSGVPNIYSIWEEEGWMTPQVEESFAPDRTRLILPMSKQSTDKKSGDWEIKSGDQKSEKRSGAVEQLILEYLSTVESAKRADVEKYINMGRSRTQDYLNHLIKLGKIESDSKAKARTYRIKNNGNI